MSSVTVAQRKAAQDIKTSQKKLIELAELDDELARLVARNDGATESVLRHLGSHSDATVRKWVASHPVTPVEVLLVLGQQFPEQLIQNPILDVLFLENPALMQEFPLGTVRAVLKRKSAPASILEQGVYIKDEAAHLALAQNSSAPEELIDKLHEMTPFASVKEAIRARRMQEPALQEAEEAFFEALCVRMADYGEKKVEMKIFEALIELPQINADCLVRLEKSKTYDSNEEDLNSLIEEQNPLVLRALATKQDLSLPALLAIAGKLDESASKNLARKKSLHPSVLRILGRSEYSSVRVCVAANAQTPREVFTQLSADQDEYVRRFVALNPQASAAALQTLAEDSEAAVRWRVAQNPNAPLDAVAKLIIDPESKTRILAAENPNCPLALIDENAHQLLNGSYKLIQRLTLNESLIPLLVTLKSQDALLNTQIPADLLTMFADLPNEEVREAVAQNPSASPGVLEYLAIQSATSPAALHAIARNPQTPSYVLEKLFVSIFSKRYLSFDDECTVKALAIASRLSRDALNKLAKHSNESFRECVALSPAATLELLSELAVDKATSVRACMAGHARVPPDILTHLAYDKVSEVRAAVALNEQTPLAVLAVLKDDKNKAVRAAVARNLSTSFDILAQLAADKDTDVRNSAGQNPHIPSDLLAQMATDKAWSVRRGVAQNTNSPLALINQLAGDAFFQVRQAVSENATAVEELLARLAEDKEAGVRRCVAANPNASSEILIKLSHDKESLVRENVASHQNASSDLLYKLAKDTDETGSVRLAALKNPNIPPEFLTDLLTGKIDLKEGVIECCFRQAHFYPVIEPYMPEVLARLKRV